MTAGAYTHGFRKAYKCGADLTGKFGYAVKISAADTVTIATTGNDFVGTVFMEGQGGTPGTAPTVATSTTYRFCTVQHDGVVAAIAGGTISAGQELTVDTNGKFVAATTGKAIVGVAQEAAVSGTLFSMLIRPRGAAA